jgi:hypothetical protein
VFRHNLESPEGVLGVDEEISDRLLIDVGGVDMDSLLTELAESTVKTALDRVLMSNSNTWNSWNSYI